MSLCQSIDTLAMAYLDDELAAEERRELELHLVDCGECKHHLDTERAELVMLRGALAPPPAPAIVAETRVDIPEASVSDAVMMLDLRNTNALMFRNPNSGQYNMVYRRDDGTIGWVEPSSK